MSEYAKGLQTLAATIDCSALLNEIRKVAGAVVDEKRRG
jgi:hypothetical protein